MGFTKYCMKNKILLICLEVKETPRLYPAFGLMYIADALIKNGYEAKIIHDYASADVFKRIIEEAKDALIVCFTTKTSPRLKPISELSKILKTTDLVRKAR